jgi:hypothetical protein
MSRKRILIYYTLQIDEYDSSLNHIVAGKPALSGFTTFGQYPIVAFMSSHIDRF